MSLVTTINSNRIRFLKSMLLFLSFASLGLSVAIIGPTLLDLQIAVGVSVDEIAAIIPSKAAGYVFGSIIAGFMIDLIDAQISIITSLILSSIVFAVIPWNYSLIGLCITLAANGIVQGYLDANGNIWIIHLWGKENPPFMQTLHFAYGIGALIAPIIAEPFLLPTYSLDDIAINVEDNSTVSISNRTTHSPADVKLKYPYTIISIYTLAVAVVFIAVYMWKPSNDAHPSRVKNIEDQINSKQNSNRLPKIFAIIFATIFMHFYVGLEIGFGTLLATYAVKSDLHLTKSSASFMTSVYWGTYTFFRCVTVFVIHLVGPRMHLIADLALIFGSNLFLVPFAGSHPWALWTGVSLMGLGCSSVFATVFGYLEMYFPVTGRIAAGFQVSATLGEFFLPFIIGKYVESFPAIFLIIIFANSIASCILFFIFDVICRKYLKKQN